MNLGPSSSKLLELLSTTVILICFFRFTWSKPTDDYQTLLNYDIESPDPELISSLVGQIQSTGVFHLPSFLSESFLKYLQEEVEGASTVQYVSKRTIVQDIGDLENFPKHSARNMLFDNSMHFIPRSNFNTSSMVHDIYESDTLLNFLRHSTGVPNLYHSSDFNGSVVGARGSKSDGYLFSWHFDEHPLGCVLLLNQSLVGGRMEYIDFRSGIYNEVRPWDRIQSFFDGEHEETQRLRKVQANPSDLYCFLGNTTLHRVTDVGEGDPDYRATIVFSYAMHKGFKHSDSFNDIGYWAQIRSKKDEL